MTRDTRGSASSRGYDRKWRRVRAAKLRADPLCEHCTREGRVRAATEVDHIIPIEQRPDLRLDWDNLQSLCNPCHERKTHGTRTISGADAEGNPTNPEHWWNQ